MQKKSQSISINTIIIAAIALAVLVVLFVIFTGRFKIFSEGVDQTVSCANTCITLGKIKLDQGISSEGCRTGGYTYVPGSFSDIKGQVGDSANVCCCRNP